jgi:hypothetical protein
MIDEKRLKRRKLVSKYVRTYMYSKLMRKLTMFTGEIVLAQLSYKVSTLILELEQFVIKATATTKTAVLSAKMLFA